MARDWSQYEIKEETPQAPAFQDKWSKYEIKEETPQAEPTDKWSKYEVKPSKKLTGVLDFLSYFNPVTSTFAGAANVVGAGERAKQEGKDPHLEMVKEAGVQVFNRYLFGKVLGAASKPIGKFITAPIAKAIMPEAKSLSDVFASKVGTPIWEGVKKVIKYPGEKIAVATKYKYRPNEFFFWDEGVSKGMSKIFTNQEISKDQVERRVVSAAKQMMTSPAEIATAPEFQPLIKRTSSLLKVPEQEAVQKIYEKIPKYQGKYLQKELPVWLKRFEKTTPITISPEGTAVKPSTLMERKTRMADFFRNKTESELIKQKIIPDPKDANTYLKRAYKELDPDETLASIFGGGGAKQKGEYAMARTLSKKDMAYFKNGVVQNKDDIISVLGPPNIPENKAAYEYLFTPKTFHLKDAAPKEVLTFNPSFLSRLERVNLLPEQKIALTKAYNYAFRLTPETDAKYLFAKGTGQAMQDLVNKDTLKKVATLGTKEGSVVASKLHIPEGLENYYVQIPDSKLYGDLAGKHITSPLYNKFISNGTIPAIDPSKKLGGDTVDFISNLSNQAQSWWKAGKVAFRLAALPRNKRSNIFLASLIGMPEKEMIKDGLRYNLLMATGRLKTDPIARLAIRKTNLLNTNFVKQEINNILGRKLEQNAADGVFKKAAKKGINFFLNMYQGVENGDKLAIFKHFYNKTGSVEKAYEMAQKALFNYSHRSPFVQTIANNVFGAPFFTFTSKAAPLMLESFIKYPQRIMKYPIAFYIYNSIVADKMGISENEQQKYLQNFFRGAPKLLLGTGEYNGIPYDRFFNMTYDVPLGDILTGKRGEEYEGKVMPIINKIIRPFFGQSPWFNMALALTTNKDPFTNYEVIDKTAPDHIQLLQMLKYVAKQVLPETPGIPGNYATSRILDALQQKTKYRTQIPMTLGEALMDTFLGMKTLKMNPEQGYAANVATMKKYINERKEKFRNKMRYMNLSPDEEANEEKAFNESIDRIMKIAEELYGLEGPSMKQYERRGNI